MIGIIGAMNEEIALFRKNMSLKKTVKKAGLSFFEGRFNGKEIVVVKSGVGKVNAAICAQILIDLFKVNGVIFTGVAGAISNKLDIGDIIISKDLVQHDVDATSAGFKPGQIPFTKLRFYKADKKLVKLALKAVKSLQVKGLKARVLTGDQFISSKEKIQNLKQVFQGTCVEMEGAAVAQVCKINEVPFVVIRSISDKADHSASVDFKVFTKKAAKNSFLLVEKMLEKL